MAHKKEGTYEDGERFWFERPYTCTDPACGNAPDDVTSEDNNNET